MTALPLERTTHPGAKPAPDKIGFGRYFTDHAFVAEHDPSCGWQAGRLVPRDRLRIDVAAGAVQYGMSIFEGLKAHRGPGGALRLFRPEAHAKRFAVSARRLCMPVFEPERLVRVMRALVNCDADWYPDVEGGSLYVRPTLLGSETFLGVRPALAHTLVVMMSPVTNYFSAGTAPLRLWAEREQVRAAPGGLGSAKTGANYAASLFAARRAQERGFDQVLWLDAHEHRYLEEVGTMNLFIALADRVVTPPLDGTILAGITRDAVLTLLREWKVPVEERRISLDELAAADARGELREVWGTGTAAVISPVAELAWEGSTLRPRGGEIAARLRAALEAIYAGRVEDKHGWLVDCAGTPD